MAETLQDMLIRQEGLKLKPYRDSVGKLTIGVGRNLDDVGISKTEAMMLLQNDIQKATADLIESLPWTADLDWPRKMVLINMAFNMGIKKLLNFENTILAVKENRWQDAHNHMLDSTWAKQVGDRAVELSKIMLTGEMV